MVKILKVPAKSSIRHNYYTAVENLAKFVESRLLPFGRQVNNLEAIYNFNKVMEMVANSSGIDVIYNSKFCAERGLVGVAFVDSIEVGNVDEKQIGNIIAHELAHIYLNHLKSRQGYKPLCEREFQAELVAMLVCQEWDIDTSTHSLLYLGRSKLFRSPERIRMYGRKNECEIVKVASMIVERGKEIENCRKDYCGRGEERQANAAKERI